MEEVSDIPSRLAYESTVMSILEKVKSAAPQEQAVRSLVAFVMAAAPAFFDDCVPALEAHIGRLLELRAAALLEIEEAGEDIVELVEAGERNDRSAIPWLTLDR